MGNRGRRRRWGLLLAALLVALLGAGLLLGGGDDDPEASDRSDRRTSTTRRRATTTTSTAPPVTAPLGPQLEVPTGAALVALDSRGDHLYVDLDTGRRDLIEPAESIGMNDWYLFGVRGGVVKVGEAGVVFVPLPTGPAVRLGAANQAFVAEGDDTVWLVDERLPVGDFDEQSEGPPTAYLVDLTGRRRSPDIPLEHGYAAGATTEGLVVSAGGRVYVVAPDGARTELAIGELLGVAGSYVAVRSCDRSMECDVTLVDVRTGGMQQLALDPPGSRYGFDLAISGEGELAFVQYGPGPPALRLGSIGRDEVVATERVFEGPSPMQWLPSGQGLVLLTRDESAVVRVRARGGEVVEEPIAALAEDRVRRVVVIPP